MTVTLERPMSRGYDSTLAGDIRHLIDNLDENIYNIVKDYQKEFCCEVSSKEFQGLGGLCRKDNSSQSSGGRLRLISRVGTRAGSVPLSG